MMDRLLKIKPELMKLSNHDVLDNDELNDMIVGTSSYS